MFLIIINFNNFHSNLIFSFLIAQKQCDKKRKNGPFLFLFYIINVFELLQAILEKFILEKRIKNEINVFFFVLVKFFTLEYGNLQIKIITFYTFHLTSNRIHPYFCKLFHNLVENFQGLFVNLHTYRQVFFIILSYSHVTVFCQ